ncbi:GSCOCG00012507001-RA-CDS, partial [Cotesia congregata]
CYRQSNKTNNFIESYHRVLRLKMGSHPSIWEFTEQLAALQELKKIETLSLKQNLEIRRQPKLQITMKKSMYEYVWDLYDNGTLDINQFLECTRHMTQAFNNT